MGNCTNAAKDTLVAATELIRVVTAIKGTPDVLPASAVESVAASVASTASVVASTAAAVADVLSGPPADSPAMLEFTIIDPRVIQRQLATT